MPKSRLRKKRKKSTTYVQTIIEPKRLQRLTGTIPNPRFGTITKITHTR